jgi:hypothetical protein
MYDAVFSSSSIALITTQNSENDSAYGDEMYHQRPCLVGKLLMLDSSTYTASITSSVSDFPEVEGRRYHAYRQGRKVPHYRKFRS